MARGETFEDHAIHGFNPYASGACVVAAAKDVHGMSPQEKAEAAARLPRQVFKSTASATRTPMLGESFSYGEVYGAWCILAGNEAKKTKLNSRTGHVFRGRTDLGHVTELLSSFGKGYKE